MSGIIVYNKDQIVFPGMLKGVSGEVMMTRTLMDTPFGLFMPQSYLSFGLLRFLKAFKEDGRPNINYKPNSRRFLTGILLSNDNKLEDVLFNPSTDEETPGSFLDILPIDDTLLEWKVLATDGDRSIPLSDMAATKKSLDEVIKFIDDFSGERMVRPIVIDRKKWHEERQFQGQTLVMNGQFYGRM